MISIDALEPVIPCPFFSTFSNGRPVHWAAGSRDPTLQKIYKINFASGIFSITGRWLGCFFRSN
jgi:hypothetical protein